MNATEPRYALIAGPLGHAYWTHAGMRGAVQLARCECGWVGRRDGLRAHSDLAAMLCDADHLHRGR